MNLAYKRASSIVVITKSYKDALVNRGVPDKKITVIYNWANEKYFYPKTRYPPSPFPVNPDRRVILFAGNAGPLQGLFEFCEIFESESTTLPVSLVIVGDGTEKPRLRARFDREGSHIHFLDAQPREAMAELYAWADFSLVSLVADPLLAPTVPSKYQASLAAAVPVIAIGSESGEIIELTRKTNVGFVADASSPEKVKSALASTVSISDTELATLKAAALETYKQQFSFASAMSKLSDVLKQVSPKNSS
jgi:colanic acid biosynthesis glycosyl transferase WcaI